ncbi:hypothetical protein ACLOJK_032410 [Asimina triloba]
MVARANRPLISLSRSRRLGEQTTRAAQQRLNISAADLDDGRQRKGLREAEKPAVAAASNKDGSDSPEKRFHAIMDKLFHSPGSKRPASSAPSKSGLIPTSVFPRLIDIKTSLGIGSLESRKRVRTNASSSISVTNSVRDFGSGDGAGCSLVEAGTSQASRPPLCRPWDRGDLMRRLATFKSMTWFGRPKVVSPVNCARRGWINVEMDIIACEACGSRLLFSNPSSWTKQQVEKAAAVFSLKLDGGHKVLCPWIDNACDEALTLFRPTPAPALIQSYRERASALLRLSALPVISSAAIDFMRNPQLEHFLTGPPLPIDSLGDGIQPVGFVRDVDLNSEAGAISCSLYCQAHKLISLCGWEPRSLPYVVDCKDQTTKSSEYSNPTKSSPQFIGRENHSVIIYSSTGSEEAESLTEDSQAVSRDLIDPASVVLDCKLCGATVGLWAFSCVPRPLELFRIVESVEMNSQKDSSNGDASAAGCNSSVAMKDKGSSLNLSIAGGPPPTKQNFKATVTLPIISRHLRAGLCSTSVVRDGEHSDILSSEQGNTIDNVHTADVIHLENPGTLERKRNKDELHIMGVSGSDVQSHFNEESDREESSLRNKDTAADVPNEGKHPNDGEHPLVHAVVTSHDSTGEHNTLQNSDRDSTLAEDAKISGSGGPTCQATSLSTTPIDNGVHVRPSSENSGTLATHNGNRNDSDFCVAGLQKQIEGTQDNLFHSSSMGTHMENDATVVDMHYLDLRNSNEDSVSQSCGVGQPKSQRDHEVKGILPFVRSEALAICGTDKLNEGHIFFFSSPSSSFALITI